MSASVARIGRALRLEPRLAGAIVAAFVLAITLAAGLATRQGMLPIAVGAAMALVATVVGLRWPLVLLLAFVVLIPIEEVTVLQGFGTISRGVGILFVLTYGLPRLTKLNFAVIPIAGWAYLAWALASLSWSVGTDAASAALTTLVQLFAITVFTADFVVQRPSIVRPVLWAYSLSAAATAGIGVATYVAQGLGTTRSTAVQDQDPAQFAAVLIPAVVFGLYEAVSGSRRLLGAGIAILASAGVLVSGTRGAWLACIVVVLFVLLPQLSARRRVIALVAIAVVGVAVYQLPGVAELIAERSGNAVSTGGAGRTDIWAVGLAIFEKSPLVGVGYANFPVAFTTQVIRDAGVGWQLLADPGRGSHNLIVGTAVELGVMGLVLLAAFLGPLVVRRGWGPEAAAVQAALIGLLTTALFLDILANRKQVWLVIALAAGLSYVARVERGRVADTSTHAAPESPVLASSSPETG
jgi:hypothetical protein